ncbi:MAG TPA: PIN domain-containing protein [Mycobacteriales bacterium]|nr:PIN domain-containing protein [Mycobacteriales bacterium]
MDAFDSDVLIYAAAKGHPLGERVRTLFAFTQPTPADPPVGVGSVLLLPEVLGKPMRGGAVDEVSELVVLLSRLELHVLDRDTADIATGLSGRYRLRAADASHLATALVLGADRFITNNQRDFPKSIKEIDVTYPADLPAG